MADRKLIVLVVLIAVLYTGHTIDHTIRGDVPWPLTTQSWPFIVVSLVIYALIAFGLYLYVHGRIGPRFFAIAAALGAAFGAIGHFSPFSDQPPPHILHAYASVAAGWLAVG